MTEELAHMIPIMADSVGPILIDPFVGSGSIPLAVVGGRTTRPPVSYMGQKYRWLSVTLAALGLEYGQTLAGLVMGDAGPWGRVWQALAQPPVVEQVWEIFACWQTEYKDRPLKELWGKIAAEAFNPDDFAPSLDFPDGSLAPWCRSNPARAVNLARYAAHFIAMQSANAYGKPIGEKATPAGMVWKHAGYNKLSPETLARGYRERPDLTRGLKDLENLSQLRWPPRRVMRGDFRATVPYGPLNRCVVYLDPPYQNTSGYQHDATRAEVVALALDAQARGARVVYAEATPIPELVAAGWYALDISSLTDSGRMTDFRNARAEWLTCSHRFEYRHHREIPAPAPAQLSLFGSGPQDTDPC